jgi:hypothetical protein
MKPSYVFVAALILLSACKKDKGVEITQESVAGTYKLEKVSFKTDSDEDVITDAIVADCALDDLFIFETDGDYTYDDAGVQCGGGDETGTWNLNSTTSISIDGSMFELVSFNGNILVIAHLYDYLGQEGKLKTFLKRQ